MEQKSESLKVLKRAGNHLPIILNSSLALLNDLWHEYKRSSCGAIFITRYPLITVCFEPFHFFFSSPIHHPTKRVIQVLYINSKKAQKIKVLYALKFEAVAKTVCYNNK